MTIHIPLLRNALAATFLAGAMIVPAALPSVHAAASYYPVTITNCGKSLTFTQAPRRIVTAFDNVAEILPELGLGNRIVGTYYATNYSPPADIAAAYHRLHVLGSAMGAPSKEVVLSVHPDFVFSETPDVDFSAMMGEPSEAQLAKAGASIFVMTAECPLTEMHAHMSDTYTDILAIGRIFDVEPRAESLVRSMQARIAAVRKRIAGLPPVSVVGYVEGTGPISVVGPGIYSDLITMAGGHNLFGDASAHYPSVSRESFAAANADVYVAARYVGGMGAMMGPQSDAARTHFLFTTFPDTNASKHRRYLGLDADVWNVGIRTPEAVEQMARAFHPQAFR